MNLILAKVAFANKVHSTEMLKIAMTDLKREMDIIEKYKRDYKKSWILLIKRNIIKNLLRERIRQKFRNQIFSLCSKNYGTGCKTCQ